ncbi:hypothetical protein B296_00027786 [Ensete ventricosum]|uniref:Uncharacterized protein n=1 Tax=Ensete ventricosum TaxID=4639 RepID=A0A426ZMF1_ENSVE|nr:hypothetical protein B296_00027786 [Ensete ventricosum]
MQSRVSIDFSCTISEIQNTGHSQYISPMGSRTITVSRKNATGINFAESRVSIGFRISSQKFKIQAIPNVFALSKSYELSFAKQHYGYKLCAKSRAKSSSIDFSCTVSEIQTTGHSKHIMLWEVT